jgi:hypothetical protein
LIRLFGFGQTGHPTNESGDPPDSGRSPLSKKNDGIPSLRGYLFGDDAINRAIHFANATVDALFRINHINVSSGNAIHGAVFLASAASDTGIQYSSWHGLASLNNLRTSFHSIVPIS